MNIKIFFDFHDLFVDAKNAWIKAFEYYCNNSKVADDYNNKMSKRDICIKYNLDYNVVETKYRIFLQPLNDNIEFAKLLGKYYKISVCSLSSKDRLIKDINKFNLASLFTDIYSKNDVINKKDFFKNISNNYDWIVYFNHEYNEIIMFENIVYIPINMKGDLEQFKNKSFTEHAKNKLLYNELSKYYMEAIANDTDLESEFISSVFKKNIGKESGTLLDCCCGVGRHDYILGNKGYKVTGIDISESQIANAKKIHSNPNTRYKVMDVRNINNLKNKFDMAICMWTTYNYLSLDKDFISFIKGVYNHQDKGSILLLDSKNIPKLKKRRVYKRNTEKKSLKMELIINKFVDNNIQNSQYMYFIKNNDNKQFYYDEEYVRFYTLDEIKKLVDKYYIVKYNYGDFKFSEYDEKTSERFIIVLERK